MTDANRKVFLNLIINDLLDTSQDLELVAMDYGILTLSDADMDYINSRIFQCDDCGFWTEVKERRFNSVGAVCSNCTEGRWPEE